MLALWSGRQMAGIGAASGHVLDLTDEAAAVVVNERSIGSSLGA